MDCQASHWTWAHWGTDRQHPRATAADETPTEPLCCGEGEPPTINSELRAGDPEVERRIIERTEVTAEERRALQDFSGLVRQVHKLKADTSPPRLTLAGLDRMLDDLQALKQQGRPAYQWIADRLREVISD